MTEQASFENSIWTPPLLPMIPAELGNTDIPAILLTDRQHNQWQFLSETIKDIPSPYSQIQDYDFSNISPSSWQPVVVPGELTMQGFDIKNNREYYYKTTISIPETFAGNRIFIRFEGVYSHCRIWVNHKYLRTHIGGFTPFDCDLTPFSDQREVTLIVGVADLEGFDEGIWNPDHKELGDSSWASFYAHHNLCGILRNATLFCLPSCFLGRIHVSSDTTGAETFLTAALSVCTPKGSIPENLSLSIQLRDQQNHICASCTEDITVQYHVESSMLPEMRMMPEVAWMQAHPKSHANDEENATRFLPTVVNEAEIFDLYSVKITLPVENPVLWDAEHPTLYTFDISLFKDNALLQRNEFGTGLRTIDYASRYGGDVNKLYINGKEIKLRGVCRHDVSYRYGRSMSAEEELREILAYKRCNINFIRTSHYPISERMLSLCDKYGIYVELENAACFQGANDFDIHCPPQDFVCSFAEMVEYARNHPSVIIWSLANESGFEESYAFRKEYRYIKEEDPERPVIFSYPDTVESTPLPYDIYSMHYQDVDGDLGRKDMPKLHDEFAHVSCYNLNDLKTDNNVRCQWGESICRGWDNIFNTDGALGCAIWSAIDDLFLLPDGVPIRHQCHSDGRAAGYGEWGAVLDIYQREKPEAFFTKKAFSPVFLNRAKSALHGNVLSLHLQNRFDHTDLKELRLHCSDASGNVLYDDTFPVSILPHAFGTATITLPSAPDCVLIRFFRKTVCLS